MALTRKMLKAMGIEDEKIDQIIEEHAETVDALKQQRDEFREKAELLPDVQKQLKEAESKIEESSNGDDEYKKKFEEERLAFEDFKNKVEADKAESEKRSLYRGILMEAGIDEKRLDSIMRVTDFDSVSVKDGKIEGAEELIDGVKKEWSDFVVSTSSKGASVDDPPSGGKSGEQAPLNLADALHQKYDN